MPPVTGTAPSPSTAPKRLPTWLVSARHARRVHHNGSASLVPYAEHHARRIGDSTTACGMLALGWTNFYELSFVPGAQQSCEKCTAILSGLAEPR